MANKPVEIRGTKKKTIKAKIWENGGITLEKSVPPKKDESGNAVGEWKNYSISFFPDEVETAIEVLELATKQPKSDLGF